MKRKIAWKVVYVKHDKTLTSSMNGHPCTVYCKGKWAEPPNEGHPFLFVFNSRQNARYFKSDSKEACQKYEVWRCEVEGLTNERKAIVGGLPCWGKGKTESWPNGTMFADIVRLISKD